MRKFSYKAIAFALFMVMLFHQPTNFSEAEAPHFYGARFVTYEEMMETGYEKSIDKM